MIVSFIDEYRDRFGVVPICTVLSEHGMQVAPSTYYAGQGQAGIGRGPGGRVRGQRAAGPVDRQPGGLRGPQAVA